MRRLLPVLAALSAIVLPVAAHGATDADAVTDGFHAYLVFAESVHGAGPTGR